MNRGGKTFVGIGLLLLAAALCLTVYHLWDDHRAAVLAEDVLERLRPEICVEMPIVIDIGEEDSREPEILDYLLNPDMDMPVQSVFGDGYIGILEIPAIVLTLPVLDEWSYPNLKQAPCRYAGSAYLDDLVIAGHNYDSHFGRLWQLHIGDSIRFTDADGNLFCYEVTELETILPAAEELTSGSWDLTLFTCTLSGQYRVAVRCEKV